MTGSCRILPAYWYSVLGPGQRIDEDIVEYLVRSFRAQNTVDMHGVVHPGDVAAVGILPVEEERNLVAPIAAHPLRRRAR